MPKQKAKVLVLANTTGNVVQWLRDEGKQVGAEIRDTTHCCLLYMYTSVIFS